MKDVMDQIARLLDDGHIGYSRKQLDYDWWQIATDTLNINVYDGHGRPRPLITFNSAQNYCFLNLERDSIESIGSMENDEGMLILRVSTRAGHCMEFTLTKEDGYEGAE